MNDMPANRRALLGLGSMAVAGLGLTVGTSAAAASGADRSGWFDVKRDFGAFGDDRRDDTRAFKEAIAAGSAAQRPIFVPPGSYPISAVLDLPPNTMLVCSNHGLGFGCVLRPQGCPAFNIGGRVQSFQATIENLMIWPRGPAPDHIIRIDNSYSVVIRNVRIHEVQPDLKTAAILLLGEPQRGGGHGGSSNILWENLVVRQDVKQAAVAILAMPGCGIHTFIAPDLEMYARLLWWRGGRISMFAPYMERSGVWAVDCDPDPADTTAALSTYGGLITSSHSGCPCAIRTTTHSFTSFGTRWENAGGHAAYVYGLPATPVSFYGLEPNVGGVGGSRFSGVTGWQRGVRFPDYCLDARQRWKTRVPAHGQDITMMRVAGVKPETHLAQPLLKPGPASCELQAWVSADDTVSVVARNHGSEAAAIDGELQVSCRWR